jgi:hypothetical protein
LSLISQIFLGIWCCRSILESIGFYFGEKSR